ncbi:MAG: SRPBCC family protein [Nannocystales bacterium]
MKKVLVAGFGVLSLVLVGVLAAAMFKPDVTHVERSRVVRAEAAEVMPHLTDMELWVKWSPWAELDPNVKWTFSDPASGVGAWYEWSGNEEVGRGKMEVVSVADDAVGYALVFIEPFESEAAVTLRLTKDGEGTKVTWGMDSQNGFATKVFMVFADFDAMLGADFERGLENLAKVTEG